MLLWTTIIVSLGVNIGLLWYLKGVLKKLLFISDNLADLYFTFRAFDIYVKSLYSMNSYHGEPMIEELIHRVKDVKEEIEIFRDIFEYTLDTELEEELNDTEEEAAEAAKTPQH